MDDRNNDTDNLDNDNIVRPDRSETAPHTVSHTDSHTTGEEIGEAAGGVSGVVAGAAIGSLGGPVGTVVGGIAGAIGGWWAGRAVAEAAEGYTAEDDAVYRNRYESSPDRLADRDYESVSPAYRLGHLAAQNPDYRGRPFTEVEADLRRGWNGVADKTHGAWDTVRAYANDAYDRSTISAEQQRLREEANNAANDDARRLDDTAGLNLY